MVDLQGWVIDMEEVKNCSTCKHLKVRASYCHEKKETIYNADKHTDCKEHVKSYRSTWVEAIKMVDNTGRKSMIDWTGVK